MHKNKILFKKLLAAFGLMACLLVVFGSFSAQAQTDNSNNAAFGGEGQKASFIAY